jgi:hypothetical protein
MIQPTDAAYAEFAHADGVHPVRCDEELSAIRVVVNVPTAADSCGLSPLTSTRPYAETLTRHRPASCPLCEASFGPEDADAFEQQESDAETEALEAEGY